MYKASTSFAELKALRKQLLNGASRTRVLMGSPEAKSGFIANGVMKGLVTFRYPAPSAPAAALAAPVGGQVSGVASGAASSSSASLGLRRSPRRLCRVLVAHARTDDVERDLDPVDAPYRPLAAAERSVYSEVKRWHGPKKSLSRCTSSGVCTELPAVLVMAAHDDPLTEMPGGFLDVPKSVAAMRRQREWASGYLSALIDETGGLLTMGTWEDVDWIPGIVPIRTHMAATNRGKWDLRVVGKGNRTTEGIYSIT